MIRPFFLSLVFSLGLFSVKTLYGQLARPLDIEMTRLGADITVLVPYGAIDEYPIWSPNSDYVGINVMGEWKKVGLTETYLVGADWSKKLVASYNFNGVMEPMSMEEIEEYKAASPWDPHKVTATDGTIFQITPPTPGTTFTISKPGQKTKLIWSQGGVYHSLTLSPDGKYLAFLSETNGLMIFATDKVKLASTSGEAELRVNAVIGLIEKEKYTKALSELDALISEFPNHPEAYSLKGQVLYRFVHQKAAALAFLEKSIELAPERAMYVHILADYYSAIHEYQKAIEALHLFNSMRPHHTYVYYELGSLYEEIGDLDKACEMYQLLLPHDREAAEQKIVQTCGG
jgi:hypothetical protein